MDNMNNDGGSRRDFFGITGAAAATLAVAALPAANAQAQAEAAQSRSGTVAGFDHWTSKRADNDSVRLFMWRKQLRNSTESRGTILFVHGSSVSSTPVFDLQIPGRHRLTPESDPLTG